MSQAVDHIVIGVAHAMRNGGKVRLRAENILVGTEDSLPSEAGRMGESM